MTVEQALAQAIALYNAGHKDEVQALCHRLLQQAPTHPAVHQLLAVLSLDHGDAATATVHIDHSLRARPDHAPSLRIAAQARYETGRLQRERGDAAGARQTWRDAVALQPASVPAWFALSLVCEDLGLHDEAQTALEQVLRHEPAHAEAQVNLGLLLQKRGELAAAMAHYALAYRQRPDTLGRIANALTSEPTGRLWLRLDDLKRELAALIG